MIELSSKGKYPKEPEGGNLLEICRKDFKNFREHDSSAFLPYLSTLVIEYENRGLNPERIKQHKENLENLKKQIESGNEKVAFHNFLRTFPTCMPYRGNGLRF